MFMLLFRYDENVNKIFGITDIIDIWIEIQPIWKSKWCRNANDAKLMGIPKDIVLKNIDALDAQINISLIIATNQNTLIQDVYPAERDIQLTIEDV